MRRFSAWALALVACGADAPVAPPDGAAAPADAARPPADAAVVLDGGPDAALARGELFAFTGSTDGKIRVYAVDGASGAWTLRRESNAGTNPTFLAFDPARRRVLAVNEITAGLVRSFSFDPTTGALTDLGAKSAGGAGPVHLSLDPSRRWVLLATYDGGTASVFPLEAQGALGDATGSQPSGAKSHWAGTDPAGTHAFVCVLGADRIAQYGFDSAAGKLVDNGVAQLAPGSGPRHLVFHPNERWAYAVNETAVSVTLLDYDRVAGKLTARQTVSALPAGQSPTGVSGAEIALHPDGRSLYASTRVFNSIAQFSIAADGTLARVASSPTGANRPRSFGLDPDGAFLYAANQDANEVVGFRVGAGGALQPLGKVADVTRPAFVGLARMP